MKPLINSFIENKNHWYDGQFYDKIIAPNQDRMFCEIKSVIEQNSSVIDIGCGTGRFSFYVSDKVNRIIGIDLSAKNILTANKKLRKKQNNNISFFHSEVSELSRQGLHFDYAVLTYVIHEVNPGERIPLLKETMKLADKLIIGDYLVPVKYGFWNFMNRVVEFLAGKEHFNNYKDFIKNGGLEVLLKNSGLKKLKTISDNPVTNQIILAAIND